MAKGLVAKGGVSHYEVYGKFVIRTRKKLWVANGIP
jgi:hypothetical protein